MDANVVHDRDGQGRPVAHGRKPPRAPGLVLHVEGPHEWVITVLACGLRVGTAPSKTKARAFIADVAHWLDWTTVKSARDVRMDKIKALASEVVKLQNPE